MFPGGMGNMQGMMKRVQKMQADMLKMQEKLQASKFENSVGGGAVSVVLTGKKELVSIKINPEAVDVDDMEMLEDMIVSAINECMHKIDETSDKEMTKITGGMKLPGM